MLMGHVLEIPMEQGFKCRHIFIWKMDWRKEKMVIYCIAWKKSQLRYLLGWAVFLAIAQPCLMWYFPSSDGLNICSLVRSDVCVYTWPTVFIIWPLLMHFELLCFSKWKLIAFYLTVYSSVVINGYLIKAKELCMILVGGSSENSVCDYSHMSMWDECQLQWHWPSSSAQHLKRSPLSLARLRNSACWWWLHMICVESILPACP